MKGQAAPQAAGQQAGPGAYFDVPGVGSGTQWTEQYETTKSLATTMARTGSTQVNGILQFKQTDVVVDWQWTLDVAQVYTAGGATFAASDYAPWNFIGAVSLPIQNQYRSVDVENGIDLYIFNIIRPWEVNDETNLLYAPSGDFAGSTALGFSQAVTAQPNLTAPVQWSAAGMTWHTLLRIPASAYFDIYYDLAITGEPVSPPHPACVSPQYMAGSARVILPSVVMNATDGGALDVAPVNAAGGAPTISATATSTFRRKAIYSSNPALLPPVYGWQYRWKTSRFTCAGVSTRDLLVPIETGQLLSCYVRLWDPAANGGLGAAISLAAITRIQLQYGSGLLRFDGTPQELQALFLRQHNTLLPRGTFCFDLGVDERGNRTNKRALNTLTTAGILVHMEFSSPTSTTAYAVMGTESLVFVA